MQLWAHSPTNGRPHLLAEHLSHTAALAKGFAAAFDAAEWGKWAGLLHDLGKASTRFQRYLRGLLDAGGDHKIASALLAMRYGLPPPVVFAIAGHHGGLPSKAALTSQLKQSPPPEIQAATSHLLPEPPPSSVPGPGWLPTKDPLEVELVIRMLFSALVDADYLDTEAHLRPDQAARRGGLPSLSQCLDCFSRAYHQRFSSVPDTPVNRLRREVFDWCLKAAEEPPGAFSLTAPTGSGKTLSSLAFALHHAVRHGLRRIIVVIPYTSIIEQTAQVFREFLPAQAVIEHHSAVPLPDDDEDEEAYRYTLATENWDAPVIVTTAVQFCDSLFSNKPGRCRKLHNIAQSVVILDEVQTLPTGLLKPTFSVLASLVRHYGVSCLLMTATQPAYARFAAPPLDQAREIVPDPPDLARRLKRVRYQRLDQPLSWEQVASRMQDAGQAMAVVNTRSDARALYQLLTENARVHLSTNLCAAHRRQVLAEIRRRLDQGQPCLLATTQVVEAGVDLDFPVVLRAIGPLVNIVQAAGRCNREGRLECGQVILFQPADGHLPPAEYRTATGETAAFLATNPDADLNDPAVHQRFFERFYQAADLDAYHIQAKRQSLDFPEVAQHYRLIPEDTIPVAVRWRDGNQLIEEIQRLGQLDRRQFRRLQQYLVNLAPYQLRRAAEAGLCRPLLSDANLWVWEGRYDDALGIQEEFDVLAF